MTKNFAKKRRSFLSYHRILCPGPSRISRIIPPDFSFFRRGLRGTIGKGSPLTAAGEFFDRTSMYYRRKSLGKTRCSYNPGYDGRASDSLDLSAHPFRLQACFTFRMRFCLSVAAEHPGPLHRCPPAGKQRYRPDCRNIGNSWNRNHSASCGFISFWNRFHCFLPAFIHNFVVFYLRFRYGLFKSPRYSNTRKNAEAVSRIFQLRRSSFLPLFFPKPFQRGKAGGQATGFFLLFFPAHPCYDRPRGDVHEATVL